MDGLSTHADDTLLTLRRTARQIVYRTGVDGVPVTIGGTYFLLAYENRFFAITAKHVVGDALPEQLLLSPTDEKWLPARIIEQINPWEETSGALDLVVYELDVRHFSYKHRRESQAYNLQSNEPSWTSDRYTAKYFLFGYPIKHATVRYGSNTTEMEAQQWCLEGAYVGPSTISHCHVLRLTDLRGIQDLNGLSGSPVFAHQQFFGLQVRPMFAGILLRGTSASGLVHFLEAQAIRTVLDEILRRAPSRLPRRWSGLKAKKRRALPSG